MIYGIEDNNIEGLKFEKNKINQKVKDSHIFIKKSEYSFSKNNNKGRRLSRIELAFMINFLISISSMRVILSQTNPISYIKLIINKKGDDIKIYETCNNCNFPNGVIINDKEISSTARTQSLTEATNIIKLKWDCYKDSMYSLFYNCIDIEEIDFSDFHCTKMGMTSLFMGCKSLTSVKFTTRINVMEAGNMFSGCSKLKSLDISKLDFSKVENMYNMFRDCSSLVSLILPNLNKTIATRMDHLFSGCSSLTSLNLSNFDTSSATTMKGMFCNCSSLTSLDLSSFITNNVTRVNEMFYNCSKLEYINLKNARINISNSLVYYYGIFNYTPGNLVIFSYDETWLKILSACKIYINCLYDPYTNYEFPIYEKSENEGNNDENICKICDPIFDSFIYLYKRNNTIYCEYNNKTNSKHDTNLIISNSLISIQNEMDNNDSYNNNPKNINELIRKKINELILMENKTSIDLGFDAEDNLNNILITLTTTKNQRNNENNNRTSIDLKQCEYLLKSINNISNSSFLYIIKLDIFGEMKIPFVEYEIYYPLYNKEELIMLDVSICKNKNMKIDISIPVQISEKIEMYNPKDYYYNNKCSKTTSNKGTDITLKDRRDNYINNNMSLCETDCELIEYNYTTNKSKCSCDIKIKIPLIQEIRFNKDKLLKSFIDVKNIANIELMNCYKIAFNDLSRNCGFYIFIFVFISFFACLIIFYMKSLFVIINYIDQIVKVKNGLQEKNSSDLNISVNKDKKMLITDLENKITKKRKSKNKKRKKELNMSDIKSNKSNITNKSNKSNKSSKIINYMKKVNFPPKKKKKGRNKKNVSFKENNEDKLNNEVLKYKDNELNSLKYEEALMFDKRSCFEYYFSLLKAKHLLIFSFYIYNNDYNSKVIKIFLFFFTFSIHLTINAMFFNDDTMHDIYIKEGSYNFIYQIPQIIYSSLLSSSLNILIQYLSLSEKKILEIKEAKNSEISEDKIIKEKTGLKIKFALFFIISFILLFLLMFYIVCFCGVYENTQKHLIKDTVISFVLSLIYPFGINLAPCIFRIPALKAKNKDKECLYKFSQIIQIF